MAAQGGVSQPEQGDKQRRRHDGSPERTCRAWQGGVEPGWMMAQGGSGEPKERGSDAGEMAVWHGAWTAHQGRQVLVQWGLSMEEGCQQQDVGHTRGEFSK